MVSMAELQKAGMLEAERNNLQQALDTLNDREGRITRMTIASGLDVTPGNHNEIDSAFMHHPPQMLDAIAKQIEDRIAFINGELSKIGVT